MRKIILLSFAVFLLVVILFQGIQIESVDEYYLNHIDDIEKADAVVTYEIRCDTVFDHLDQLDPSLKKGEYIPKDGIIFPKTKVVLRPDDSVFNLLDRICRKNQIQMEYEGASKNNYGTIYVEGIHHLYEFSCGPLSGWTYVVNGEMTNLGADQYHPKDGDYILWQYTCDLGRDLGTYVGD